MITLTITESEVQVMHGIPRTVTVESNNPATIFYTLDGTDPDVNSSIYTGPIRMPGTVSQVILKVFATDGIESSAIITSIFSGTINGAPFGYNKVTNYTALQGTNNVGFPFATLATGVGTAFGGVAMAPVDDLEIDNEPNTDGYDYLGNPINGTDLPETSYTRVFTNLDRYGRTGWGIGTLPTEVTIRKPVAAPKQSSTNDAVFNPRALVIFQDGTQDGYNIENVGLNRANFSLTDSKMRDGTYITTRAAGTTGTFVRSEYNDREQVMTYYYHDRESLRWIISKEPYSLANYRSLNLSKIVFSPRDKGAALIFQWVPFIYRKTY